MDKQIALLGLIEIASSLSMGILILFITYRGLKIYARKLGIAANNTAYGIVMASILFAVGYMMSVVLQPIMDSFRLLSEVKTDSMALMFSFMAYGALYIGIAYAAAVIISLIGGFIYTWLTPIDEIAELKNNNIAVALVLSCIIIVLMLMCKSGVSLLVESIVPYPDLPPR